MYASQNIMRVIKLRGMIRAGHAARMRNEKRTNILVGNPEGKCHYKNLGIDGKIISEWILGKCVKMWTGFIWLRTVTNGGLL
jgi:hypothetical protein